MITKTIKYTDYNGVEREEDFRFNLSKAELVEMEMGVDGGLTSFINKVIKAKDSTSLVKLFKDLVLKAYGVKTEDGKRFMKSEEIAREFSETEAYSQLFMELAFDDKAAIEFIEGIIPSDINISKDNNQLPGQTTTLG